jgi:hypothetical protein
MLFGRRVSLTISALVAACLLAGGPAGAEGTTRVQQSDGVVQMYHHVNMRLVGQTLWLRSGDHKGVLEVATDACSFAGDVKRCLPYKTTLHQHGKTHQIEIEHGMVYLNLTGDTRRLPHSSEQILPHQVVVLLHTMHGTYVSVKGTLDK